MNEHLNNGHESKRGERVGSDGSEEHDASMEGGASEKDQEAGQQNRHGLSDQQLRQILALIDQLASRTEALNQRLQRLHTRLATATLVLSRLVSPINLD